ncbi:MAG: PAS domain-containing protein [Bacteroidota bacterium]
MRMNIQPTNEELVMRDGEFIVSKTDLKGQITYGNRTFMEFAGHPEKDLLGAPHNIIRHPDMPRGVFQLLWDTIRSNAEIFAYVKNMSANGAFYWAFANVSPVVDGNNNVIGYCSVRRKPSSSAIQTLIPVYREMVRIEQKSKSKESVIESVEYLKNFLNERTMSYEEFILSI